MMKNALLRPFTVVEMCFEYQGSKWDNFFRICLWSQASGPRGLTRHRALEEGQFRKFFFAFESFFLDTN